MSKTLMDDALAAVKKELIERVKERRREHGLTQEALAKSSTVSFGSLKRFERTGEISLESLIKIAYALGRTADFKRLFWRKTAQLPSSSPIDITWN